MNNTLLLQKFDLLATAPGGVARLRELILTLAVQGKLVPQDPADEPARELLKRIRAEKDRLMAEGKIKRDKPLAPVGDDELPFELPKGWEWVTFGVIAEIERGGSPRPIQSFLTNDPDGLNWIKIGDTDKGGKYITSTSEKIRKEGLHKTRMVYPGDFLLTNSMSFGRPYITQIEGCIHDGWLRISPPSSLNKDYLYSLLSSSFVRQLFVAAAAGGVVLNLNAEKVRNIPIPLPPLPEQARIVARVEELMRVCDALETQGRLQAAQHTLLVNTLLDTLTASATPEELADNWQRVAQHFDTLLDRPSAIDALEQTILQLAVRGQLVPQDPTDEPASELLKRIRAEKDRLIAEGKIKRDKPLAPIGEEEQLFGLPAGWEWVRLIDLGDFKGGKTPSTQRPEFWGGHIPWITPKDMKRSYLAESEDWVTSQAVADGLGVIQPNSVLMVVRSGILRRTFPVAINTVATTINQDLKALEMVEPEMATYVLLMLKGFEGVILRSLTKVGTTVESIQFDLFSSHCFPLPPLPEQARIVTRVAQLRRLCAELRQRLTQSQTTQAALAEALVAE